MKFIAVSHLSENIIAVVSSYYQGFLLLSPVVGSLSESDTGNIVFHTQDETYNDWEVFGVCSSDTEIGRDMLSLSDEGHTMKGFRIDQQIRRVIKEYDEEAENNDVAGDFSTNLNFIIKGCWIDAPWQPGFSDRPGTYIVFPSSNTSYGNYNGGFPDVAAAEAYNTRNQIGGVVVNRHDMRVDAYKGIIRDGNILSSGLKI